jgi:hypothetical protein
MARRQLRHIAWGRIIADQLQIIPSPRCQPSGCAQQFVQQLQVKYKSNRIRVEHFEE